MNIEPPKYALQFLRWFCREDFLDEIEGDLVEIFEIQCQENPEEANRFFWWQVIRHFRPDYIKAFKITNSIISSVMLQSYLKIGWRTILRNKSYSFLNISGLALGMACFLFIFFWIEDETSVDGSHADNNLYNVYKVQTNKSASDQQISNYATPIDFDFVDGKRFTALDNAQEAIPEIEAMNFYVTGYELPWGHPETFQVGEKMHKLKGSRASADFFKVFNFPLLVGDASTALSDKSSLAISRSMANLFFDSPENALGKSIRFEDKDDFTISAVFEDIPTNNTLQFEYLLNWEYYSTCGGCAASNNILTTLKLKDGTDLYSVRTKLNRIIEPFVDAEDSYQIELGLQPFADRYLNSNFENGRPQGGRIEYVRLFAGVGIFILIIACINFMSLSTARASKRAKEVGVKKAIGSKRSFLVGQFFSESLLMSIFALVVAIILVVSLLPAFNAITGKQLNVSFIQINYWLLFLGLTIITGMVAGSYPAVFLSSLKPIEVLKGGFRFSNSSNNLRKGLTIFQFSLSILLLICTLVVSEQTTFIQNSHLGYDRENMIYVRLEGELTKQEKYNLFKNEATKLSSVKMVDRSSESPHAMGFEVSDPINWEGKLEGDAVAFKPASVGFDFIDILKLEVVEGRKFSKEIATDSAEAFMVNEEAVKQMGMADPIGKWISAWGKRGYIVGILKDFHTHSFHETIKPLVIDVKEYESFGVVMVRTEAGKTQEAIQELATLYQQVNPNYPFDFQFLDQEYQKLYRSEQVIAQLSKSFAAIAIIISCFGLLGLAMFAAEQRIKEIGIRKVLGASVISIAGIFSKGFLKLVMWAFLISAPISWFLMNEWLQSFAYRIELSWWFFAISGFLAISIAVLTIGFQTIKSALSNPINALKSE